MTFEERNVPAGNPKARIKQKGTTLPATQVCPRAVNAGLRAHDAGASREQENITTAVQTEVNGRVRPPPSNGSSEPDGHHCKQSE